MRQAGYVYDSSVFPGSRSHGGLPNANPDPHVLTTAYGDLVEFPISLVNTFGKQMYFFRCRLLAFFPYWLMKERSKQ
ncbi:MAG: DUF3473 domain-containing protein [Flavobacteriales bacterium]|nr:DUF3473 domain-containing protein [Flavobacteriales bacterium]